MSTRLAVVIAFITLPAASVQAETYRTGTVYNQILTLGGVRLAGQEGDCTRTWYDPAVFPIAGTSELRLLGQGGNPSDACATVGHDALYAGAREPVGGSWSVPSTTDCTILPGFSRCGRPRWVWASPSVVTNVSPTDERYYMAFVGGNGDFDKGKIYWAVSQDGDSWDVYHWNSPPGEPWTPVIYPKYGSECLDPFGVSQLAVAFEDGYFYILMNYVHRIGEEGEPDGPWESVAFRFSYDPNHPWGFGPVKQIFHDGDGKGPQPGAWVAHSGRFVFTYDPIAAEPGDPRLGFDTSMWTLHVGGKDIERDAGRGRWIHAFTAYDTDRLHWQESASLATNDWSARADLDSSTLDGPSGKFPGRTIQYPALWYGSVAGQPDRMYIWVPVDWGATQCQIPGLSPTFAGLGIASAELIYR